VASDPISRPNGDCCEVVSRQTVAADSTKQRYKNSNNLKNREEERSSVTIAMAQVRIETEIAATPEEVRTIVSMVVLL
jgi:hypothetical protein